MFLLMVFQSLSPWRPAAVASGWMNFVDTTGARLTLGLVDASQHGRLIWKYDRIVASCGVKRQWGDQKHTRTNVHPSDLDLPDLTLA